MKIALINPYFERLVIRCAYCSSFSKSNYSFPPIDLIIQSGFLHKQGHELKVFDFNVSRTEPEQGLKEVIRFAPDGIFILIGSGTWKSDFAFVDRIREYLPNVRVVASGSPLLYKTEQFFDHFPNLDAVLMDYTQDVVGRFIEGEKSLPYISYRENGNVVINPPSTEKTFSYPPGRHELFPLKKYRNPYKSGLFTTIITSLSCPYKCSFCTNQVTPFKYRPIDEVIEELKYIYDLGIREIKFKDWLFVSRKSRTKELCQKMIGIGIKAGWQAAIRADIVDKETLTLMKDSGCHTVQVGVESGNDELLKKHHKRIKIKNIVDTFSICKKLKIKTVASFVLGLPGETEVTIKKTIDFAKKIECDVASFNVATPLYGSKLREESLEKGYIPVTDSDEIEELEIYSDVVIETPYLSKEKLKKALRQAYWSFYMRPKYLANQVAKSRNCTDIKTLIQLGVPLLKNILFSKVKRN